MGWGSSEYLRAMVAHVLIFHGLLTSLHSINNSIVDFIFLISSKKLNLRELTKLPPNDPNLKVATLKIIQLQALVRGHQARGLYKKLKFISLL